MRFTNLMAAGAMSVMAAWAATQQGPGAGQQQQQQQQRQQQQLHQQQQAQADQVQRTQRMQQMTQQMERVMTMVRESNRWMEQNRVQQGFVNMGRALEGAGERLHDMLREMDRLCQDPELQGQQERLRRMDRLQERLQLMLEEMDQARETLRDAAQAP